MKNRLTAMTSRMSPVVTLLGIGALALCAFPKVSFGATFVLPANGNIIGNIQYTTVRPGDTLSTLGRRYDMGGYEMVEANPGVSYTTPRPGTSITVPSRFVLPDAPRKGIVVNLAEMRLYYYHPDGVHVSTFPVGVGQQGWNTPLGNTQVVRKREHPTWVVPDSIMENHIAHGEPIPKVHPPGPENPLGDHALSLGFANIVIHGTPYPKGVGVRASHGCIRMLPEDVATLYHMVKIGTPVAIIHQSNKIGRLDNKLYLETHVPIADSIYSEQKDISSMISKATGEGHKYQIQWQEIERIKHRASGYPQPIGSVF